MDNNELIVTLTKELYSLKSKLEEIYKQADDVYNSTIQTPPVIEKIRHNAINIMNIIDTDDV